MASCLLLFYVGAKNARLLCFALSLCLLYIDATRRYIERYKRKEKKMEERIKAGPGLKRDIKKDDAEKTHDTQAKNLLKYRPVLAAILHLCIPEYKDIPLSKVVDCIERDSISEDTEVAAGETVKEGNSESKPNNEKILYFDRVFDAKIPNQKEEVRIGVKFDLEVQGTVRSVGYPLENRGIYYLSRLISSQLNYVNKTTKYDKLKKVYSIWICTSDMAKSEVNSIVRYRMTGEKVFGNDFAVPSADLMELIVIKLGDISSFVNDESTTSDDIIEFLYGLFAYHSHPDYLEKYIDLDEMEDSDSIRKELNAMSGTGQILLQEGKTIGKAEDRAEMTQLVIKAGQLRNEGITDIEKYRNENIPDEIAITFINLNL